MWLWFRFHDLGRHKRNGIQLKTISKRTIRLRSGIRFEINAVSHSFKSFEICICPGSLRFERFQKTAERLFENTFCAGVWVAEVTAEWLTKT